MTQFSKNKPIVFINQASGYLMVDIVNAFQEEGYTCILITGSLVERRRPLNKKVKLHNIIQYNNTTALKRIFTWSLGAIQIYRVVLFKYRKAHLFIVSNPPLAPLLPLILRNSFSLLIFDVYPDAITELNILKKNSPVIRLWEKANLKIFKNAESIFTITEGIKEILCQYARDRKITVVPLWTDNKFLKHIPDEENPFISSHDLAGKFVVLYSGNIGLSNDIEILADVAKIISLENIVFIIIGSGARKKYLEEKVKNEGISNLIILPWQDVTQLSYTLSAAHLGVVAIGKGASKLAMPSKIYSLLSIGVPILGIAGQDSDLRQFIEKNALGCCFPPENKKEIADYILHLSNHPKLCKSMINNALKTSKLHTCKNTAKFLNPEFQI